MARTLMLAVLVFAIPVGATAGSLDLEWNAPTTNVDGSPLVDLAAYRVYAGLSAPACPDASYQAIAAPDPSPMAGDTFPATLTGLVSGSTYWVQITAVDTSGNESPCTPAASGVARTDTVVTPTALNFGSVPIGTTPTLDFTVQNFGPTSMSGTATTAPPFSIVAGGNLNLAVGASQVVRVAFTPPAEQVFAGTVTLATTADTVARSVAGNGVVATPAVLQFSQAAYTVTEGATAGITVTRTGGTHGGVTVNYTTGDGSSLAGPDYAGASGTLTFGPGVTAQVFSITAHRDKLVEGTETISLTLSSPQGGAVLGSRSSATLSVNDKLRAGGGRHSR